MAYFNEFPHTRNYDGDLGYLIKMYKKLVAEYASIEEQYEALTKIYEMVQNDIENITIEQLQKWLDDGTLENIIDQSIIDKLQYERINVKSYGAKGDGKTDDTEAILDAISHMTENSTLFFPNGDYIVYSDYENNHSDYGYDYEKCIKIVGLKNIAIEGEDRNNTRIRPLNQMPSVTKYNYPVILSIYNCEYVSIRNITIESKGESYGDTDAITTSDPTIRAKQCITNGGQDILILESSNVNLHNVNARICGSVACLYAMNSTYVNFYNCFANAMSLGYAGFTVDNFYNNSVDKDYKCFFYNCQVYAETITNHEDASELLGSSEYAGKCGILIEGSNIPIYAYIYNFYCADVYGNTTDRQLGQAVITSNAELYLDGLNAVRVSGAVQFKSNQVNLVLNHSLSNIHAECRAHGVGLYEDLNMGNCKIQLSDSFIKVLGTENYPEIPYMAHNACIRNKAYSDTTFIVSNCTLESTEFGVYFPTNMRTYIMDSILNCKYPIDIRSGIQHIKGNDITFSDIYGIYIDCKDENNTVGYLNTNVTDNIFKCTNERPQTAFRILNSASNPALVQELIYCNNTLVNCYLSGDTLTAGVSVFGTVETAKISATALAGENTALTLNNTSNACYFQGMIIDNDGVIHKSINNINNNILYLPGDVRSKFTIGFSYPYFKFFQ